MMTTGSSVTLLFDRNLSRRLPRLLADLFPESLHVNDLGMATSSDGGIFGIWQTAAEENLTIVTKDTDFVRLSEERGHPPKVIRVTLGNCSREAVEDLLRVLYPEVTAFTQDAERGLLNLP